MGTIINNILIKAAYAGDKEAWDYYTEHCLKKIIQYYQKRSIGRGSFGRMPDPKRDINLQNIFLDKRKTKWYIFVSSTFQDMQAERDLMKDRVLPFVNEYAQKYGNTVEFIDLRWGIDVSDLSEEEQNRKVLRTCFEEIDRCKPLFVGLLGERYGWIPPKSVVDDIAQPGFKERLQDISVTAMEIEYGIMADNQVSSVFYFRNDLDRNGLGAENVEQYIDNGEMKIKLQKLKDKVRNQDGVMVREYKADIENGIPVLDERWVRTVYADIVNILEKHWETHDADIETWQEREWIEQNAFLDRMNLSFMGREDIIQECTEFVQGSKANGQILLLHGSPGSGKSSIACRLTEVFNGQVPVYFVACGRSEHTDNVNDLLRFLIWEFSRSLGKCDDASSITDFVKLHDLFFEYIWEIGRMGKRVVIIIDAIDQLVESAMGNECRWLTGGLPESVSIICTSVFGSDITRGSSIKIDFRHIKDAGKSEIKCIAKEILRKNHKNLSDEMVDYLSEPNEKYKEAYKNPLFLTMLVNDLCMMDRFDFEKINQMVGEGMDRGEATNRHIRKRMKELGEGVVFAYNRIITRMDEKMEDSFVLNTVALIASSRHGLRETDIKGALKVMGQSYNAADFSWVRNYFNDHLVMVGDRQWDFSHPVMRRAILENRKEFVENVNQWIIRYYEAVLVGNRMAQKEIVHHYFLAEEYEKALELLLRDDVDGELISMGLAYEFVSMIKTNPDGSEALLDRMKAKELTLNQREMMIFSKRFRENVMKCISDSLPLSDRIKLLNTLCYGMSVYADTEGEKWGYGAKLTEELLDDYWEQLDDLSEETDGIGKILMSLIKGMGIILRGFVSFPGRYMKQFVLNDATAELYEYAKTIDFLSSLYWQHGEIDNAVEYADVLPDIALWIYRRTYKKYKYALLTEAYKKAGDLFFLSGQDINAWLAYREATKVVKKWYFRKRDEEALLYAAELNRTSIMEANRLDTPQMGSFLAFAFPWQKKATKRCGIKGCMAEAEFFKICAETARLRGFSSYIEPFLKLEAQRRTLIFQQEQNFETEWKRLCVNKELVAVQDREKQKKRDIYTDIIFQMEKMIGNFPFDLEKNVEMIKSYYQYQVFLINECNEPGFSVSIAEKAVKKCNELSLIEGAEFYYDYSDIREKVNFSLINAYASMGKPLDDMIGLYDSWIDLIFAKTVYAWATEYMYEKLLYTAQLLGEYGLKYKQETLLLRFYDHLVTRMDKDYGAVSKIKKSGLDIKLCPMFFVKITRLLCALYIENDEYSKGIEIGNQTIRKIHEISEHIDKKQYQFAKAMSEWPGTGAAHLDKILACFQICFLGYKDCDVCSEHYEGALCSYSNYYYKGDVLNGVPHGSGTLTLDNQEYAGEFDCGRIEGKGVWIYEDGRIEEGMRHNDKLNGLCRIKYKSGNIYEGRVHNGLEEGYGVKRFKKKEFIFEGHFYHGYVNGKGKLKDLNGDIIEEGFYCDGVIQTENGEPRV